MSTENIHCEIRVSKLSKATYGRWKIEIRDVLESHKIWEVADGSEARPTPAADLRNWKAKDSKARSIIRSTLDDATFDQVCDCETSVDIINRIRTAFEPKSLNVLLELLREFFTYSWKPESTVGTYVAGLKVIARKIEALESEDFGKKFNEKLIMAKILGSLPRSFSNFVTSWSLLCDDTSLTSFLEKLMDAERGMTERADDISPEVFKAKMNFRNKPDFDKKKFQGKCHNCGKKGHMQRNCWSEPTKCNVNSKKSAKSDKSNGNDESGLSASCLSEINKEGRIIADSGANIHLTGNLEWFSTLRKLNSPVALSVANNQKLWTTHIGDIYVEKSIDGHKWENRVWENVFYAENEGKESLFSTTYMENTKGYSFQHGDGVMRLMKGRKVILGGTKNGSQYIPFIRVRLPAVSAKVAQSIDLWHQRLGHVSDKAIRAMSNNILAEGMDIESTKRNVCDACHFGKQTINEHPTRGKRKCSPGERFHSDVCHVGVSSWNNCKYFMTIKDEASGYRRVFFLRTKENVADILHTFFTDVEKETGRKAISLRTDNGTEYLNEKVKEVLKEMNITHELSPPNVKQCNGIAERENRTLCDTARSLLFNTDLSRADRNLLWTEAIGTAAYLRNRVPNRGNDKTTPYNDWYGRKPNVSHLRVFGAPAFVHIPNNMRHKMDAKARKTIFVGYDRLTDKIYRIFDPIKKVVERVSDVVIRDEVNHDDKILFPLPIDEEGECEVTAIESEKLKNEPQQMTTDDEDNVFEEENKKYYVKPENAGKKGRPIGSKNKERVIPETDRVLRNRTKSAYIAAMKVALDPVSYQDAMSTDKCNHWRDAMDEEMSSLMEHETWKLVYPPRNSPIVSCRWVFKSKTKPDGTIDRYKARLVVRGFSQIHGVDYFETFSPVVRYESVRAVLAIAAKEDMEMKQFDIKTAFLNGPLEEVIYMQQPEGFEDGTGRVCLLQKSLYGLKQASRNWNKLFKDFVVKYGMKQSESDPCVYTKDSNTNKWMILCLYVDDGLMVCKNEGELEMLLSELKKHFKITAHQPTCYVGMEIVRNRELKTIHVSQKGYITQVLSRYGMQNCKAATSPLSCQNKLSNIEVTDQKEENYPYREAIGCLNYIALISRPDISYAVNVLARHSNNNTILHWREVKHVLRYLKGTINISLSYSESDTNVLVGYCDSDYAGDLRERKSTSGYVFILNGGPIAWSSSLQRITALSSSEAEYMSISEALKELLWLRPLLASLGLKQIEGTELRVDNQAAIAMSKNPEFRKRTKHIGVRFHRVRQEQEAGNVVVNYIPSNEQLADLCTKILPWTKIVTCLRMLRMTT